MTLSGAIADIQSKALTLSGIKAAPVEVPEVMNQFPFAVSYAQSGNLLLRSAGFADYLHTIVCEIHVSRQLLPKAITQAMTYIELFGSKLVGDPALSNSVSTVNDVRYEFGHLVWAGEDHIGVKFFIDVKIQQT